jgi:hypothetical protein
MYLPVGHWLRREFARTGLIAGQRPVKVGALSRSVRVGKQRGTEFEALAHGSYQHLFSAATPLCDRFYAFEGMGGVWMPPISDSVIYLVGFGRLFKGLKRM